jgi:hypothetical protein
VRDPIRSLVYAAAERAVRHVFVGGTQVVRDGQVTTMDLPAAAAALEEAQRRLEPEVQRLDWAKRSHLEISALVYCALATAGRRVTAGAAPRQHGNATCIAGGHGLRHRVLGLHVMGGRAAL